jgi:hypothetical protein
MKQFAFILAVASMFFCRAIEAENIKLKDGSSVSGKIISVSDDSFQIKTAYGNIQVPRSEIVSITFPENQPKAEGNSGPDANTVDESLVGPAYTNRTANFQVAVPKGWTISEALRKQSKDIVAALTSEDQTLFFLVTPEKFSGNFTTYRVLAENQYQTKFKDYEKISENEIQLDGKASFRMIWRGKNTAANDAKLKSVVYFVPYDGRMVRLTFITLEPLFEESLPIFEKIALSYHSLKQ